MKSILSRAAALLLCLATLLSATSCFLLQPLNQDPESVYGSLLDEYAALLQAHADGEDVTAVESPTTKGLSNDLFMSLKAVVPETEFEDIADMGYAFRNLDGDGVYECFLMKRDGTLYALYACKSGKPYLVEAYLEDGRGLGALLDDDTVFRSQAIWEGEEFKEYQYRYAYFKDGAMEPYKTYITEKGSSNHYILDNGERREMTDDEFGYFNTHVQDIFSNSKELNKEAGLWFQSVMTLEIELEIEPDSDLPVFDASSYDALLTTLNGMTSIAADFSYDKWFAGDYDHLMQIQSPEDYRIYAKLLPFCIQNIGYAYKDLNGDGTDELFILSEKATNVFAVFTLCDGRPTLLYLLGTREISWLDGEGHFLVADYTLSDYTELEYSAYKLDSDGNLELIARITGGQYVTAMLIDGQMTPVDYEAYRAEYARIFKSGETEWNEDGKMLTFTPLPEADN